MYNLFKFILRRFIVKKRWFLTGFLGVILTTLTVLGLVISSCSSSPNTVRTGRIEEGINVGIIRFAENSEDLTGGSPVYLDREGRAGITHIINTGTRPTNNPGTSLFHAVHLAMANLSLNESYFPQNLDSVYIITFTDGLDNQSAGLSRLTANRVEERIFDNDMGYARYIEEELVNRRIAGVPIIAYSVGIKGDDVLDDGSFERHLQSISSPGNYQVLDHFDDLQYSFSDIADSLNLHSTRTSFVLTTPLLVNTRIRVTFDADIRTSADVPDSTRYIEGTVVSPAENTYALIDVVYGDGITSSQRGGPVTGEIDGTKVSFIFDNVTGYDPLVDRVNTNLWRLSEGHWQHDVEYSSDGSYFTTTEAHSTVIYLVLDCSRSLSPEQNDNIRRAAVEFINSLYTRYYGF